MSEIDTNAVRRIYGEPLHRPTIWPLCDALDAARTDLADEIDTTNTQDQMIAAAHREARQHMLWANASGLRAEKAEAALARVAAVPVESSEKADPAYALGYWVAMRRVRAAIEGADPEAQP